MEGAVDASGRRQGEWAFYDEAGDKIKTVKFVDNVAIASRRDRILTSPTTWTIVAAVSAPALIFGISELARAR